MMGKYKSKYRSESARWRDWDYGAPGSYFITICTRHRRHFFGEIQNGEMILNEIGKIAHDCWSKIPDHFKNTELGEFTIMPNHVHGIIIINGIIGVGTGHWYGQGMPCPYQCHLVNHPNTIITNTAPQDECATKPPIPFHNLAGK